MILILDLDLGQSFPQSEPKEDRHRDRHTQTNGRDRIHYYAALADGNNYSSIGQFNLFISETRINYNIKHTSKTGGLPGH